MKSVALGTKLYVEVDSDWVPVGNLTSLPVPGPEKGEIDVTDFDSTAAEFLADLPDNGSLDFSGFYNSEDAGQQVLLDDANDPDAPTRNFKIDFTRQEIAFLFGGYVRRFRPTAGSPRGPYTFDGSIRVSGAVTTEVIS